MSGLRIDPDYLESRAHLASLTVSRWAKAYQVNGEGEGGWYLLMTLYVIFLSDKP